MELLPVSARNGIRFLFRHGKKSRPLLLAMHGLEVARPCPMDHILAEAWLPFDPTSERVRPSPSQNRRRLRLWPVFARHRDPYCHNRAAPAATVHETYTKTIPPRCCFSHAPSLDVLHFRRQHVTIQCLRGPLDLAYILTLLRNK